MFKVFLTLTIVFGLAAASLFVTSLVLEQRCSIKMANLQLADDASTPEQKAKFLRAFLADMDEAGLPKNAAWVWASERNRISNQRLVIESLVSRCDALSTLNKESMGYAQGMTQVTGQEFDHATSQVAAIYEKGLEMSYGWLAFNAWWICLAVAVLFGFCVAVTVDD